MTEYKKNEKGFTMIEMIVSIFIIAMLSGIFLANYHYYNRASTLNMAAQKLASDLRKAQSYSLGLKNVGGTIPIGGWGIVLETNINRNKYYYISGDIDNNHDLFNAETLSQDIVNLPTGLTISSLIVDGGPSTVSTINIIYEPPMPTGWICRNSGGCNGQDSQYSTVQIVLTDGTQSKNIIANKFGLVDVVN
jgi:prepilin-type N-terminal cleavage/methylation domain-containing protein